MFGKNKKIEEDIPRINLKGQRQYTQSGGTAPEINYDEMERQWYGIDKGPRMLPRA